MPGLYGLGSNVIVSSSNTTGLYAVANVGNVYTGNVASSNTTGLYIGAGTPVFLNNAELLLLLLDNNGNVNFALDPATGNSTVFSYFVGNVTGTYGNANVAAYLAANIDATISNLNANAAVQAVSINTITANLGTLFLGNASTNANLGAYQSYANANAAVQATSINATNANLGAFQIYANSTFGTSNYGNSNVAAYLPTNASNVAGNYFIGNGSTLTGLTGAGAGSYGSDNVIPTILVDATGRIVQITTNTVSGGGTYGNANVAAYLSSNTDTTISNLNANAAVQAVSIDTITANLGVLYLGNISTNANLGAYQTYANANAASQQTSIDTINANLGAYQTYANANIGTLYLGNISTNANLGAYQTYANANAATQATSINTINANLGAYQMYANANIGTLYLGNISTNANLGAFQTYANATFGTSNYGNANVAIYLAANTDATISNLNANAAVQAVSINAITANIGAYQTYANANAATQQTSIDTINANLGAYQMYANANIGTLYLGNISTNANLGAFQTYANNTFGTSNYGNANVAVYLASNTDATISNLNANAAVQAVSINTITANLGAYQTYANANAATQQTNIDSINANLGAYQTYANANIGTLFLGNASTNANLGAYQIYANANIGTLFLGNASTNANLGAFQTYVNNTFITSSYSNVNVAAYLPTYTGSLALSSTIIDLYSNAAGQQTSINSINANLGAFQTYANANIGTLFLGNASTNANLGAFQIYANTTFGTSNYSNVNVAAYLPTYFGNIGQVGSNAAITLTTSNTSVQNRTVNILAGPDMGTGTGGGRINIFASNYSGQQIVNTGNINMGAGAFLFTGILNLDGDSNGSFGIQDSVLYGNNSPYFMNLGGNIIATSKSAPNWFYGTATDLDVTGGYLVSNHAVITEKITTGNLVTTQGIFWSNGVSYSTSDTYGNANVAAYLASNTDATISNLNANAAVQAVSINAINANLGAFQTYANTTFITSATQYSNVNVAAYLPKYTGAIGSQGSVNSGQGPYLFATNITVPILRTGTIYNDGSTGDGTLYVYPYQQGNSPSGRVFISGSLSVSQGTNITLESTGTDATPSTFYIRSKGSNTNSWYTGNIDISAGNVNYGNTTIKSIGNVTAAYFIGDGSQLTNLPGGGSYGNTQVAAYLPTYFGNIGQVGSNAAITLTTSNTSVQNHWINLTAGPSFGTTTGVGGINITALNNSGNTNRGTITMRAATLNMVAGKDIFNEPIGQFNLEDTNIYANGGSYIWNAGGNLVATSNTAPGWYVNNLSPGGYVVANNAVISQKITTGNIVTTQGIFWANGVAYSTGGGGTYGNTQVAAYLAANTDATISNLNANAAVQAVSINSINANIGAYQTFANANAATQATSINSINANLGAYQTYANANAASQATSISSITANVGTLFLGNISTNANLGAFQTYANTTFGTGSYGNTQVSAYLAANLNTAGFETQGNIRANTVYAYQFNASDNIYTPGRIDADGFITGNVFIGNSYIGDGSQLTNVTAAPWGDYTGQGTGSIFSDLFFVSAAANFALLGYNFSGGLAMVDAAGDPFSLDTGGLTGIFGVLGSPPAFNGVVVPTISQLPFSFSTANGFPTVSDTVGNVYVIANNPDGVNSALVYEFSSLGITFPDATLQNGAAISLATLQSVTAASSSFSDFQSRIASL